MHPQDADRNTLLALHCGLRTNNCIIAADAGHLIATVGVDNLLIVQDGNVTLVADRRDEGNVKQLVEFLKKKGMEKYLRATAGVFWGSISAPSGSAWRSAIPTDGSPHRCKPIS